MGQNWCDFVFKEQNPKSLVISLKFRFVVVCFYSLLVKSCGLWKQYQSHLSEEREKTMKNFRYKWWTTREDNLPDGRRILRLGMTSDVIANWQLPVCFCRPTVFCNDIFSSCSSLWKIKIQEIWTCSIFLWHFEVISLKCWWVVCFYNLLVESYRLKTSSFRIFKKPFSH